jgi:hypothetical protein
MPQYLVAIHHPDNFDPSTVTEETMRDIGALNKEMMATGVRFFAGGLQRKPRRSRCGRSPMARCSSRTDRIWKLRRIEVECPEVVLQLHHCAANLFGGCRDLLRRRGAHVRVAQQRR